MMSVSLNPSGWTTVTPSPNSNVIYVSSSSGDNSNTGLSPSSPVQTIGKGESLLRSGFGDELLLKRGDVWHSSFGRWIKSGFLINSRFSSAPMAAESPSHRDRCQRRNGLRVHLCTGSRSCRYHRPQLLVGRPRSMDSWQ